MGSDASFSGWVVVDASISKKRTAPRFYLVAATGPAQALELARQQLGDNPNLSLRGPTDAAHLKRRKMNLGDVCEIVSRPQAGS